MSRFSESTADNILSDVRSIASASDFGKFVAQRAAERTRFNPHAYTNNLKSYFPYDSDASTIVALMDKVADLSPLPLPREQVDADKSTEHTWLACIRECAEYQCDSVHPRHVEVNCRLIDVLISCFTMEPETEGSDAAQTLSLEGHAKDDAMCFDFVARTLVQLFHPDKYIPLRNVSGASDGLIDFLFNGLFPERTSLAFRYSGRDTTSKLESILARFILQSASPGKWITQLVSSFYPFMQSRAAMMESEETPDSSEIVLFKYNPLW